MVFSSDFSTASEETQQILKNQVYIQSSFQSFNTMRDKFFVNKVATLKKMTYLEKLYNSYVIESLHFFVPKSKLIFKKKKTQTLKIKVMDNFDNK